MWGIRTAQYKSRFPSGMTNKEGLAEGVEGGLGFVIEGAGFGGLLAQAFDDVGGGFGHECFVAQAGFGGGEILFVFGEVFGEALALRGAVDLAFGEGGGVEACG